MGYAPPADGYEIVKRVVGVGGDTIGFRDGSMYRNGTEVTREMLGPCDPSRQMRLEEGCVLHRETLGAVLYETSSHEYFRPLDREEFRIPEAHVYVLGDNRDQSNDSRNPVIGAIPVDYLRGLVIPTAD